MKTAGAVALIVLGIALLLAYVLATFLTEYAAADGTAIAVAAAGALSATALFLLLRKRPRAGRVALLLLVGLLVALPASWLLWPARITHARFGLTVHGILPVPALDLVVTEDGLPWFRDKTHRITREEVARWLGEGVTDVVIGTGWQGVATVDPEVLAIPGVAVHAMATPAAIRLDRELRDDGRRVVLILHTTC